MRYQQREEKRVVVALASAKLMLWRVNGVPSRFIAAGDIPNGKTDV